MISLRGKAIRGLLILVLLSSCKKDNKDLENISEEYFYKISYIDTNRVDYSVRSYEFIGDTLKLETKRFSSSGKSIPSTGDSGMFLIKGNIVRLLKGGQGNPILGDVVYNTHKLDSCWVFPHPYYHQMKNCYRGLTSDNKEFIFTSEQQAADGISRTLYLDKNYTLLRETSNSPLENFREMIRVDKSKIPYEILENIH